MADFIVTPSYQTTLDNNNASIPATPVAVGEVITVVANSGFRFFSKFGRSSVYLMVQDPSTGFTEEAYFTLNGDGSKATYTWTGSGFGLSVKTEVAPIVGWPFTEDEYFKVSNNNAVLKFQGLPVEVDDVISWGSELTFHAVDGWEFYNTPNPAADSPQSSVYFSKQNNMGETSVLSAEVSEDYKTATVTLEDPSVYGLSTWGLTVLTNQVVESVTGKNNVYLFNIDKLGDLNAVRFVGQGSDVFDYGQFILNILELPFPIDEALILEPEAVVLGNLKTSVEAPKITTDIITLDLGLISVPNVENNLLDYANTITVLNLPWADSFAVETKYVIGESIGVIYNIDCYSGIATIHITSTKVNGIILTRTVDLGLNIPYMGGKTIGTENFNIQLGGDNGVRIPYINVLRSKAILPDGFFSVPIVDEGLISSVTGFLTVDDVDLSSGATRNEKREIINQLRNGVIVNA